MHSRQAFYRLMTTEGTAVTLAAPPCCIACRLTHTLVHRWTAIHAAVMTQPDRTLETFGSVDLRDIQAGSASRVNEHIIRMLW